MGNKWIMPEWMQTYAGKYIPDQETCERHMNDHKTNVVVNAPLAMMVVETKGQVALLTKLHEAGLMIAEVDEAAIQNNNHSRGVKMVETCTFCGRESESFGTKRVGGYTILECCTSCEDEIAEKNGYGERN